MPVTSYLKLHFSEYVALFMKYLYPFLCLPVKAARMVYIGSKKVKSQDVFPLREDILACK